MTPKLESKRFGTTPDGKEVTLFTLSIPKKIKVSVMDYGATLTHLFIPDRDGKMEDVVLGFDSFEGYLQKDYLDNYCYLGSTIGRVAGRFTNNQFSIDGKTYHLPLNQGNIHLHGGMQGWDKKLWEAEPFETENSAGVTFYYKSVDGEENYPGNLEIWVTYTLDERGTLEIKYRAITDQKTIINPTNHAYFNLSGDFSQSIEDHDFFVDADHYLSLNEKILPTGEIKHVAGSPFDFRNLTNISKALHQKDQQIKLAGGIDHCFVLNQSDDCAILFHKKSGRKLTLSTTEPGLQVYTGNYLNQSFVGKGNIPYGKNSAICLETQHFPDSCSHDHFPSILLLPGEVFQSRTVFSFSIEK
ncbi:aldose epimerase family protein [Cecembia calidifontis]|jgi:aldose 1-epimerase|uniref:Aldose 1-epimerase n=1 Tax=Cecembia calidifontis TaxID=1187080 RepID=A0A4Q7PFX8_9BACT|nr:aldose epimerase family protein [Cecembia calidifontis]RZS98748.1 aldose 1-epimerase [Cecembia calidifontis]